MDRISIKEKAKTMIKDNLWYIWKPMVLFFICVFALEFVALLLDRALDTKAIYSIVSFVVSVVSSLVAVGYSYYCLGFVRGQKMEAIEVYNFAKKNWIVALLASLLVGLNVGIGMVLLIVPGIIAALGLSLYTYVIADNPELDATNALRKCWEITNGYKVDILVFILSFIGWCILAALTLGILFIWLMPYMTIAETLLYESLKK